MALPLKSPRDIERLRSAGALLWRLVEQAVSRVRPGRTSLEIATEFEESLIRSGALPAARSVGFPSALSVCINEEASHGVPGPRIVHAGDVVTLDAALSLDGWCADLARSMVVGDGKQADRALVAAAGAVTKATIDSIEPGKRWSEVVAHTHKAAASLGVNLVVEFCGHGIGAQLQEAPRAGFAYLSSREGGNRTSGGQDFILRPGLVLTIEPVLTMGSPRVRALDDGWTMVLEDRSAAAFEERTIAVTRSGPVVLTSE